MPCSPLALGEDLKVGGQNFAAAVVAVTVAVAVCVVASHRRKS